VEYGGKMNLKQHFCQHRRISTLWRNTSLTLKVKDRTTAALSGIKNEVYWVQQKAKEQQLTLMDVWKR
jgi:hypothetical protein